MFLNIFNLIQTLSRIIFRTLQADKKSLKTGLKQTFCLQKQVGKIFDFINL